MQQQSTVIWNGSIKNGAGEISTSSGAVNGIPFSFSTRFEGVQGINPEELLAAAHASCFTMALSALLSKKGFDIIQLRTVGTILADKAKDELTLTSSHLKVCADVVGISESQLRAFADEVKASCPISRALNLEITVEATLKNNKQEVFLEHMI